jgi:hypothetical protein
MQETETSSRNPPGRSCVACRKRKIKCDRDQPCRYCSRLGLECVYLDVKPKEREAPTDDLGSRLERIEALLEGLNIKVSNSSLGDDPPDNYNHPPVPLNRRDSETSPHTKASRNGKLVSDHDEDGRYVTCSFWTGLDEADAKKTYHSFESSVPTSESTPIATTNSPGDGSTIEAEARSRRLLQLHPTVDQIFALWQLYLENVDPIFKLSM